MSTRPRPSSLKSLPAAPTGPSLAGPASAASDGGAPKVVGRTAVLSSVRPDPQQGDGRYPIAWLHIVTPQHAIPTATSVCACGRNRSAVGHKQVIALVEGHTAHRTLCALRTTQEGIAA
ncbi:hypothetical protein [Streptomyces sp. NBC_01750]|uniref:hypothetical protein n=1 Tax=Streptomyces sp. NBC_01750 TaxID=2975928 RepID=UPI002DDA0C7B|nr:hypothetical protein [Streptomyces sp. NBC_01750]WSD33866.1 hypothetical protein OG966_19400 [Streptomyces sp. NBC_01750]